MKNTKIKIAALIVTLILVLFNTKNLFSQWIQQQLPNSPDVVLSIAFSDMSEGLVSGWRFNSNNSITASLYSTSNFGANWISSEIPDSIRSIVGIEYINPNTVYMAGAYNTEKNESPFSNSLIQLENFSIQNLFANLGLGGYINYKAILLKSTNGGTNWIPVTNISPVCTYYNNTDFLNNGKGILVGSSQNGNINPPVFSPHVFKTLDYGNSWVEINTPLDSGHLIKGEFVNENLIVSAGFEFYRFSNLIFYSGAILISRDGGNTWSKDIFDELTNFTDIHFINSLTGFVTGMTLGSIGNQLSVVYKTTNSGLNWFLLNTDIDSVLLQKILYSKNETTGYLIGNTQRNKSGFLQYIARTTDYGLTWSNQNREDSKLLVNGVILDPHNGFLTSAELNGLGSILHTTNGGSTFINNNSNNSLNSFYLSQNFPNPFNPITTISYSLPSNSFVSLKVYDVLGNEIRTLVNQRQNTGTYNIQFDGIELASGVYFYKLSTDKGFVQTKKMLLTK